MHRTIAYAGGPTEDRRAINDMVNYIGWKRAKILARTIRSYKVRMPFTDFTMFVSITGVSGRPVEAFYDYFSRRRTNG